MVGVCIAVGGCMGSARVGARATFGAVIIVRASAGLRGGAGVVRRLESAAGVAAVVDTVVGLVAVAFAAEGCCLMRQWWQEGWLVSDERFIFGHADEISPSSDPRLERARHACRHSMKDIES